MRHIHQAEQWVPYPIDGVFDFFANPENLPHLMPEWQKARIEKSALITPPPRPNSSSDAYLRDSIAAGQGTRMTITFRPFPFSPIRVPWDAEITEFIWNDHFCDVQHRGPFAFWKHCHRLEAASRAGISGTVIRDHVEYALPLGVLGDAANALFVKSQMAYIFRYRQGKASELLAIAMAHGNS